MAMHTFFELMLGGGAFQGVLTHDGPGLRVQLRHTRRRSRGPGYVPLGVAAIRPLADRIAWRASGGGCEVGEEVGPASWWVVKYDRDRCIDIDHLSEAERITLSRQFGVPVWYPLERDGQSFYRSVAFEGLKRWVREHPRLAQQHRSHRRYLEDWYERARAEGATGPIPNARLARLRPH